MMDQSFLTNWIWLKDREKAGRKTPGAVYFRKEFTQAGPLEISANCRYKLYINGIFVQEGPQKGTGEAAYVDPADISAYIRAGERNTAAVEVLYYPEESSRRNDSLYYSPYPCLYIRDLGDSGELNGKTGWKCLYEEQTEFLGEPFMPAPIQGMEKVRGRRDLAGWKKAGYDDSWWEDAAPYTVFETNKPIAPFNLEKRTIPLMDHEKRKFTQVVCVRDPASFSVSPDQAQAGQWQEMIKGNSKVTIPANTTQIVEISAGEEMCGYPTLSVAGGEDACIEILYSECYGYPQPDEDTDHGKRKLPPKKEDRTDFVNGVLEGTTDVYFPGGYGTEDEPEQYTPFLFRTFRYIQIKITTGSRELCILNYDYLSTGYPLKVKTYLETSDPVLNQVWDISLRSLKRCMHETYVDCPFYEQLQYTMDSRAEILFTYAVSGDDRLARQCMDAFRKTQRSDGVLQASAPAVGVNVIPGFNMFYIMMVHDHMMYFGDQALVRDHISCIDRILEYFHRHLTEKGLVGSVGGVLFRHKYWSFIDWCPEWNDTIGVPTAALMGDGSITMESLLYLYGLEKAAELSRFIGRNDTADEYVERARCLKAALLRHCVGKNGLIQDGPEIDLYSTHCQVWAVLTGLVDEGQGRKNLEQTFDVPGIPQCSVSMSSYLLEAFKKVGMVKKADRMWDLWRKMVKNHVTTCVESSTDERSDCHAWGALILYALPSIYLGIRPVKPGFAEYERKPDLGHLKWIRGQVQTPAGVLEVNEKNKEQDA